MKIILESSAIERDGTSRILNKGNAVAFVTIRDGKYYWRPKDWQGTWLSLPYSTRESAEVSAKQWLRDRAGWV